MEDFVSPDPVTEIDMVQDNPPFRIIYDEMDDEE